MGVFILLSAGKALALTPLPSCYSDNDCAVGYRCIYLDDRLDADAGYCAKTYVRVTAVPTKMEPTMKCNNLWWIDDLNKECSQKQFCGAYAYQGLKTFFTAEECKKSLLPINCAYKRCGDANCDGLVNTRDLIVWMRERGGSGKTADFNNDGKVDIKDYDMLRQGLTKKCKVPTPTRVPTRMPTPIASKIVNWTTNWANFTAFDYRVQVSDGTSSGRIFGVNPSKPCNSVTGEMVCVNSNPPGLNSNGLHYMTLEVTWFENDIEMRMFIYLYSDGKRWWSNEIRVYNGQAQPNTDWVYFYGKFFDTPVGQSFNQSLKFSLTAADPKNGNTPVTLSFSNLKFEAFKNYFNQITKIPTRVPTPLTAPLIQVVSEPAVGLGGILTLRPGQKFSVTGILKNLPGVLDKDYTRAFFFGPIFEGACSNTEWTLTCVANKAGDDKIYVEVYRDGITYRSNIIGIRVMSGGVTAVPVKYCNTKEDCSSGEICYQPPMPTCPEGTACAQVMPKKYCKGISVVTTLPSQGVTKKPTPYACQYNGDADGDGGATIKDFGIWKSEFMSGKINKADFDCNRTVNLADYEVWKNAFLRGKKLMITPGI